MIRKTAKWIRVEGYLTILLRAAIFTFLYSLLAMLACYFNPRSLIPAYPLVLIGLYCVCLWIVTLVRSRRFSRQARRKEYGHPEKLDQESFQEIAGSKTLCLSEHYLVWHKGIQFRIYHIDEIAKAYVYGKYRPALKKGIMVLELKNTDRVEMLNYAMEGENAVNVINAWVEEAEKKKYVCGHCGGPNEIGAEYCAWCGEKLVRQS